MAEKEKKQEDILTKEQNMGSTITPTMGLILPLQSDQYNIDAHNYNSDVIDKYITGLIDAGTTFESHVKNVANPHAVSAAQVGAYTKAETDSKDTALKDNIEAHKDDVENPHGVTKAQVGLGSVSNLAITDDFTDVNTAQKYASNKLVKTVKDYSTSVETALNTHKADVANPHKVDKVQVGLGNVQNYKIYNGVDLADPEQYATANAAKTAYDKGVQALDTANAHKSDVSNPHKTTASQVGTYDYEQIDAMIAKIEAGGFKQLDEHIADSTNPHKVSAAQVGAYTVAQTDTLVKEKIQEHTELENPHKITQSTIGLGMVANHQFYIGLDSEEDRMYASAGSLRQSHDKVLENEIILNNHLRDLENPHKITPGQIDAYTKQEVLDIILENPGGGALEAHILDYRNPHKVSCEQIGALETIGGTITGSLSIENNLDVTGTLNVNGSTILSSVESTTITTNEVNTKTLLGAGIVALNEGTEEEPLYATSISGSLQTDVEASIIDGTCEIAFRDIEGFLGFTSDKEKLRTYLEVMTSADVNKIVATHADNIENPHQTTAGQVGAYTIAESNAKIDEKILVHSSNVENPHKVSKSQVGLGNVLNFPVYAGIDLEDDKYYTTAGSVKIAYDRAIEAEANALGSLNTHITDVANPHKITKAQVGLDKVANYEPYSDVDAADNTLYATAMAVNKAYVYSVGVSDTLTAHSTNTSNPHQVSCSQIGALPTAGGTMSGTIEFTPGDNKVFATVGSLPVLSMRAIGENGNDLIISSPGNSLTLTSGESRNHIADVPLTEDVIIVSDQGMTVYVGQQDGFVDKKVTINSNAELSCAKVYNAVWNDYAEYFPKEEGYFTEAGDIVALRIEGEEEIYELATDSHNLIVGVHSAEYGHLIGGEEPADGVGYEEHNANKFIPVGLAGRLHVKFYGRAVKGTKVVPSHIPGVGRAYRPEIDSYDKVIGYLVENKYEESVSLVKMKIGK